MKRSVVAVLLVGGAGAFAVSAGSAVHPKVTRAQAVKRLQGMLGAKPQGVHLVWADERLTDVVLEWTAYSPHARIRPLSSGPVGRKVKPPRFYRGRGWASISANGDGFAERLIVAHKKRRTHSYAVPDRSYTIRVALVQTLWQENLRVQLAPLRTHPAVSRKLALHRFRGRGLQPRRIWLVIAHGHAAWLAAVGHGRYKLLDASG